MFSDAIDTYYAWVYQRMQIVNPSRILGGVVEAQDWPQIPVQSAVLWLLVLASTPVNGQRDGSQYEMLYENFCQWTWIVQGTDLGAQQQGANRGDRYRTELGIKSDLRNANYPGFSGKVSAAPDPVTGLFTFTPVNTPNGIESVFWSRLKFNTKDDKKSGLLYSAAPVEVYAFESISQLVA